MATCVTNVGQSVSDHNGADGLNWFSVSHCGLSMLRQDVLVANKIIDQLRDLLYRKLVEGKGKIQMFYNQIKYDKRRTSHGKQSSSEDESINKEDKNTASHVSKLVEERRAKAKLRTEAKAKLRVEDRAKHQAETGLESIREN